MHNFKNGINWIADPTGNTPFANMLFVSKSGDDTNTGIDPNAPKLSVQSAVSGMGGVVKTIIVGDGSYIFTAALNVPGHNFTITGDGNVVFIGNKTINLRNGGNNGVITFNNIVVYNFQCFLYHNGGGNHINYANNCIVINSPIDLRKGAGMAFLGSTGSVYINSSVRCWASSNIESNGGHLLNCIFINSPVDVSRRVNDCYLDAESSFMMRVDPYASNNLPGASNNQNSTNYNNLNGTVGFEGIVYADLASFKAAGVSAQQASSINVPPGFRGSQYYDFSLSPTSEMIGKGSLGRNITFQKTGDGYSQGHEVLTPEGGAILDNVGFDADGYLVVTNNNTMGILTTGIIDFQRTVPLDSINLRGITDYQNHVPDFNNEKLNPNKMEFEMRWAEFGQDITTKPYRAFLWNQVPYLNGNDQSNGDPGFVWTNLTRIRARYVQLRITLRNNYQAL